MHIGLILDGNRRWAKARKLPKAVGHKKGAENFDNIVQYARKRGGISAITAYALSTENLKRSEEELKNIFKIFEKYATSKKQEFIDNKISAHFLGNLSLLPVSLQKAFSDLTEATRGFDAFRLNICVAYGGRDEILRAGKKLSDSGKEWTEKSLGSYLDTSNCSQPDLIIRPGGKMRLSNFLIWQSAYSELYFSEKMWPEFNEDDLEEAIRFYERQQRNFGK